MIYRKALVFVIVFSFSFLFLISNDNYNVFAQPINNKTLIIYDQSILPTTINNIKIIGQSFSNDITAINEKTYKYNLINNYSKIIVLSSEKGIKNRVLLSNIAKSNIPVCWIGSGFENLIKEYNKNINVSNSNVIVTSVLYNKVNYPISIEGSFLSFSNTEGVKVKSSFSDGSKDYPYILDYENIMYTSVIPNSKILMNIFSENLNSFFNKLKVTTTKSVAITLNLENFNNIKNVLECSEYMNKERIHFWVVVSSKLIEKRSENLMNKLQKIQSLGGGIIVNTNSEDTYENILKILLNYGVYPLGVYLQDGSFNNYENLKNNFSLFLLGNSNTSYLDIADFPYKIVGSTNMIIPSSLTLNNLENEMYFQKLKYFIKALPLGSFSNIIIPSNTNLKCTEKLINCIKSENLNIVNIKTFSSNINLSGFSIGNINGTISTTYNNINSEEKSESFIGKINSILIIMVGFFCVVFLLIFIYYKYLNKRKFLR